MRFKSLANTFSKNSRVEKEWASRSICVHAECMKRSFSASLWQESNHIYVAQCLELDIASQGETEEEALSNLKEALELHFEDPVANILPEIKKIQAEISVA